MSLEIIEYTYTDSNSVSEILGTIKQKTGLELTSLGSASSGMEYYNVRFPDMEESQKVEIKTFTSSGTFFIDATNHFLCYTVGTGMGNYNYVDNLYKALVYDFNGILANVSTSTECEWSQFMNIDMKSGNYLENDYSKNDITLGPLKVWARNYNAYEGRKEVQGFIKNCYVNYERKFQRGLKFTDQNNNEFITLGGYLLYYNGKHK